MRALLTAAAMAAFLMVLAVLAITAAITAPARAHFLCWPRDDIVAQLRADGERPMALARGGAGQVVLEVWAAPTGAYSVFHTLPDGLACVLSKGQDWTAITDPEIGGR